MKLDDYTELVEAKCRAGDLDWLRQELVERMRVNVGLAAENAELRRRTSQPTTDEK